MAKITKIIQSQDSDLPSEGKNFLQIDLTKKNPPIGGFYGRRDWIIPNALNKVSKSLLRLEVGLSVFSRNELLFKRVSAILAFSGADDLDELLVFCGVFQGCNNFLCHGGRLKKIKAEA